MDTDRREVHCKASIELDPTLDGFDELRDVAVARIEARIRIHNSDDRTRKCIFAVAERFDKDLPQEKREMCVAVGG